MGYHWLANTEPDLPFDAFMFRQAVIAAVKVKKVRYTLLMTMSSLKKNFRMKSSLSRPFPYQRTCFASSGSGRRTNVRGAGSMSCLERPRRSSSILRKITGTPTSMRRNGRMHHSGSTSPYHPKKRDENEKARKRLFLPIRRRRFFAQ